MYPTLSDLLKDVFGFDLPLPIQSFGFMLAVSFFCAAWTLSAELKRKTREGLLKPVMTTVTKGEPASASELLLSFLTGFIIGFKLLYIILNYSSFVEDTQGVLLSSKGNLIGGVIAGAAFAYMRYRERRRAQLPEPVTVTQQMMPAELVGNFTMIAAVAGIIGAKVFHNLENPDQFAEDPIGALLSFSGLTMYGGLIVGAAAVMWYGKKNGIHPLVLSDATAPGLMLAYGTGRLGCQIAGDGDWGIVNLNPKPSWAGWLPDWAWSYNYPHNVVSEGVPIPGCTGHHCMMLPDPVYPTPLYEAVTCILLFFVLWSLRTRITVTGKMFALYLLLNGIERLLIEQIRVNNRFDIAGFNVTQAEVIALLLILTGIAGLVFLKPTKQNKYAYRTDMPPGH